MARGLYCLVLAGGSGTRFWPLSRKSYPKQFLALSGRETMIQKTYRMALNLVGDHDRIFTVTHTDQSYMLKMQLGSLLRGRTPHILEEPISRNTAAAIGLGALEISQIDPEAVIIATPSDHVIQRQGLFKRLVIQAAGWARSGSIVTFGIKPTRVETGFGYMKAGRSILRRTPHGSMRAFEVAQFVEKPSESRARTFLRQKKYFWNSGIFVFKAKVILDSIRTHLPKLSRGLETIKKTLGTQNGRPSWASVYEDLPKISIDIGVMEKLSRSELLILPADVGWNDVGSWSALFEVLSTDRKGNIIRGNIIPIDCTDSVLIGNSRPVAVIGARSSVVVDTPDATLVCDRDRSQEVRVVAEALMKKGAQEQLEPKTSQRPWGTYTVLESGPGYKIKRIEVKPGARLSLQLHHHRSEHWVVVEGTARVTRDDEVFDVAMHQSTYIPKGSRHRIENPGKGSLSIIEVQNGDYLGEDDIVRFQDDYGRMAS